MTLLNASIAGDTLAGLREPASGAIRDIDVATIGYGSAVVAFAADLDNQDSYEVGIYLDGELAARLPATSISAGLAGMLEGAHSISIHTNLIGDAWPDYHGDPEGQRAYITWDRCEDTDCRAYRVYWDAGQGGSADTLLAELRNVSISEAINRKGAEGEPGRVTWYGGFTGDDPVNDVIELVLDDTGAYSYSCLADSDTGTFSPAQTLSLPYGVVVEVQDLVTVYGDASTYEIPVGPPTQYLSALLDPGDYVFKVSAVDAAGNETVAAVERTVRIYDVPAALPGVTLEWDNDTETMTVKWDATAAAALGIVDVNVYSNVSYAVPGLVDYIIEDVPMQTVAASVGQVVLDRTDTGDGQIKLYLRPVDADGIERRAVALVQFTMPATPEDQNITLGVATNVQLIPQAAGAFRATWDYRFDEEHDDLVGFEVAIASTSGGQIFTGTAQVDADEGDGYPLASYEFDFAGPYTGTYYAVVRAMASADVYTDSAEASGVADATAPTFDPELYGISQ